MITRIWAWMNKGSPPVVVVKGLAMLCLSMLLGIIGGTIQIIIYAEFDEKYRALAYALPAPFAIAGGGIALAVMLKFWRVSWGFFFAK